MSSNYNLDMSKNMKYGYNVHDVLIYEPTNSCYLTFILLSVLRKSFILFEHNHSSKYLSL